MTAEPKCITCKQTPVYAVERCKSCYGKALYYGEIQPKPRGAGNPTARPGPQQWMDDAACRHEDPDLCFPTNPAEAAAAKAVCAGCPVRADCLDYALATRQPAGIWGGTTEDERRELRRNGVNEARRRTRKENAA